MSLVEKLCNELGVKIGEEWKGNDGLYYYINSLGELCNVVYKDNLEEDKYSRLDNISRVLAGDLKPTWEPKEGEKYYVPYIGYNPSEELYNIWEWVDGREVSVWHKEKGFMFKTKEEAIEMAENILDFIKEKRQ